MLLPTKQFILKGGTSFPAYLVLKFLIHSKSVACFLHTLSLTTCCFGLSFDYLSQANNPTTQEIWKQKTVNKQNMESKCACLNSLPKENQYSGLSYTSSICHPDIRHHIHHLATWSPASVQTPRGNEVSWPDKNKISLMTKFLPRSIGNKTLHLFSLPPFASDNQSVIQFILPP